MTLLHGGRVVTPDGVLDGASLRIEGETIAEVGALEPGPGEDRPRLLRLRRPSRRRGVALPPRPRGRRRGHRRRLRDRYAGRARRRDDDGHRLRHPVPRAAARHGVRPVERQGHRPGGHRLRLPPRDDAVVRGLPGADGGDGRARGHLVQALHGLPRHDDGGRRRDPRRAHRLPRARRDHRVPLRERAARRRPAEGGPRRGAHHAPLPCRHPPRRARGRGGRAPRGHRRAGGRSRTTSSTSPRPPGSTPCAGAAPPATRWPQRPARSTSSSTSAPTAGPTTTTWAGGRSS